MAQTGIVLQGGGALGAYELGALKRLFEEPNFKPDLVSGVSIGAITAAALVGSRGRPIETIQAMWDEFAMPSLPLFPEEFERFSSLFGDQGFYRMRFDYFNFDSWTNIYDTSPLRETLIKFIDFDKINSSGTRLFLTATNISTGNIEVFDNRKVRITPDHILASGALPPGFPMVEIDHNYYWDGGLFDNSPLSPVIEHMDPDPSVLKEIIVINLFPNQGAIPKNMLDVRDRTIEITYSNKFKSDVGQASRINEYVEAVKAIDSSLPADSPARKLPGYQMLKQYMLINDIIYIENNNPEIVFGAFDFSRKSLDARIDAGYRDAAAVLSSRPRRSLPKGMLRATA